MSLKAFHIVFVCISILLSVGFGAWCFVAYAHEGGWGYLIMGIASAVAAVALIIYGKYVLKKLKHISYL